MEDEVRSNKEDGLLYRLQKVFDDRYVLNNGAYKIWVALVFTSATIMLSSVVIAILAVATKKLGL